MSLVPREVRDASRPFAAMANAVQYGVYPDGCPVKPRWSPLRWLVGYIKGPAR